MHCLHSQTSTETERDLQRLASPITGPLWRRHIPPSTKVSCSCCVSSLRPIPRRSTPLHIKRTTTEHILSSPPPSARLRPPILLLVKRALPYGSMDHLENTDGRMTQILVSLVDQVSMTGSLRDQPSSCHGSTAHCPRRKSIFSTFRDTSLTTKVVLAPFSDILRNIIQMSSATTLAIPFTQLEVDPRPSVGL